jgi:SAP domain
VDGPSAAAADKGSINYVNLKIDQLRAELKSRSLPLDGKKADMVARLQRDDEEQVGLDE